MWEYLLFAAAGVAIVMGGIYLWNKVTDKDI